MSLYKKLMAGAGVAVISAAAQATVIDDFLTPQSVVDTTLGAGLFSASATSSVAAVPGSTILGGVRDMQVDWVHAVTAVRAPLGPLKSRTLKSANFTRSLPGAPDGEYVVIQFDSQFEHKASAVETVTPMRDKDGIWRVAGYYIK